MSSDPPQRRIYDRTLTLMDMPSHILVVCVQCAMVAELGDQCVLTSGSPFKLQNKQ